MRWHKSANDLRSNGEPRVSMGAFAWNCPRALLLFGVLVFDLVYTLGTMIAGDVAAWIWWPIGMALHLTVGAIWAIFYAYFFWSTYDWRPSTACCDAESHRKLFG